MRYADFLRSKMSAAPDDGVAVTTDDVHPFLHDWQAAVKVMRELDAEMSIPTLMDAL